MRVLRLEKGNDSAKKDKIFHDVIEKHFKNYPDSPAYKFYLENIKIGENNE